MKRAIVLAVLAVAALWPLAHYVLVAHYSMDNWKFGGWAMYTTPRRTSLSALFTHVPGGYQLVPPKSWPEYVRVAQRRFDDRRKALGELCRPDDLAAAALTARPDLDNVVVLVQVIELDPSTDHVVSTRRQYEYPRSR
jgi:hypothetical protein